MNLTTFFRLRKPEGSDPVDVKDFNDNFDVIDKELNDRPKKTGNAGDMTTAFNQAPTRTNLVSGEKLSTSLGKVSKFFADLKTVAFSGKYGDLSGVPALGGAAAMGVADNDTTNNKNFLPTARIVYEHGQEIDQLSSNIFGTGGSDVNMSLYDMVKSIKDRFDNATAGVIMITEQAPSAIIDCTGVGRCYVATFTKMAPGGIYFSELNNMSKTGLSQNNDHIFSRLDVIDKTKPASFKCAYGMISGLDAFIMYIKEV